MGENTENFGSEIAKLAEIVEILDNSFFYSNNVDMTITLEEVRFRKLLNYLNYNTEDKKCIVSIGNVNFTFLKK
jgi:phosphopantetheine adenylyltransferase